MNADHFRRRANDYCEAALRCTGNNDKRGDLYSIAALFRSMADDLEWRRKEQAPRLQRPGMFAWLLPGKAS
jgi:hypothetical protein